jgi:hypothetical protein
MEQQAKPLEKPLQSRSLDLLNESEADLTKICWTQVLREAEPQNVQRLPLPPLPDDFDPDKLFS